jgi:hypothetical protein
MVFNLLKNLRPKVVTQMNSRFEILMCITDIFKINHKYSTSCFLKLKGLQVINLPPQSHIFAISNCANICNNELL